MKFPQNEPISWKKKTSNSEIQQLTNKLFINSWRLGIVIAIITLLYVDCSVDFRFIAFLRFDY